MGDVNGSFQGGNNTFTQWNMYTSQDLKKENCNYYKWSIGTAEFESDLQGQKWLLIPPTEAPSDVSTVKPRETRKSEIFSLIHQTEDDDDIVEGFPGSSLVSDGKVIDCIA